MNAEHWRRIQGLMVEALPLAAEERKTWLEARCADVRLLAEVEALLDAYDKTEGGLEASVFELLDGVSEWPRSRLAVGSFVLGEPIGAGGVSVVYEGVPANGVGTSVAVKLLARLDIASQERLRGEGQWLSRLRHPAIVSLKDTGVTDDGRPYLILERVFGLPIDRFCDRNSCSLIRRVRLFLELIEAVAYIHEHSIVHRDLKPSNILVDEHGQPKLLDFGNAKSLLDADRTRTRDRMATAEYASPEQLRGEPMTLAVDIYALGVILHQLLSGSLPRTGVSVGDEQTTAQAPLSMRRSIERAGEDVWTCRGCRDRDELMTRVGGRLELLVRRALACGPEPAYVSVLELAADLRGWLARR